MKEEASLRQEIFQKTGILLTILVGTTFGIFSFQEGISRLEFQSALFVISALVIGILIRELQTEYTENKEGKPDSEKIKIEKYGFFTTGVIMSILFVVAPLIILLLNNLFLIILILFFELGYSFSGVVLEVLLLLWKKKISYFV